MIFIAIYHCSIKIISRGKGKSAVAAAAYRSGEKLINNYDGVIHDYTKKSGIAYTEIMLPSHAPPDFQNRSVLWNSVEKIEKAKNSQFAREIEIALEEKGFIIKTANPKDSRSKLVTLTEKAKAIQSELENVVERLDATWVEDLTKEERKELQRLLLKILKIEREAK